MKAITTTLFTLFFCTQLSGALFWDDQTKEIATQVQSLDYLKTEQALDNYAIGMPDNQTISYLRYTNWFYQIFVTEQAVLFEDKKEALRKLISKVKAEEESPWKFYFLTEMYLAQCALSLKFDHKIHAFKGAIGAYNSLSEGLDKYPEFHLYETPKGLMEVALSSIPESYRFLVGFIRLTPDANLGIASLEKGTKTAQQSFPFLWEKHAFVELYVKGETIRFNQTELSEKNYPKIDGQPLLQYVWGRYYLFNGNPKRAYKILQEDFEENARNFPYLSYLMGRTAYVLGKKKTPEFFNLYLSTTKVIRYQASSKMYLMWHAILQEENAAALTYKRSIQEMKYFITSNDEEAQLEVVSPHTRQLIYARQLFDQGLFEKAEEAFKEIQVEKLSVRNKQRYAFRLGMVQAVLEKEESAALNFKNAIQGPDNTYEKAMSYFFLGQYYLKNKASHESAQQCFENCLDQANYPFEFSTQQKAQLALSEMPKA